MKMVHPQPAEARVLRPLTAGQEDPAMAGAIGFMLRKPHKFPGRQHGSIDDAVARAFASGQKRMARRKAER
jgi:hypothetical protein